MNLSRKVLSAIDQKQVQAPAESYFNLPEKVLQFGTGVLLRGLPDYFIDKANKQGIFNGRIVVVKSTTAGTADAFDKQDGLFTLCVRGLSDGKKIEENIINASVSRVLSANTDWAEVLDCATDINMQLIISNTTEVGITLVNEHIKNGKPPKSFPAKLLAFLYKRYQFFKGSPASGMVIVPTELITDNGKKLEAIVEELAHFNELDYKFIDWLETHNHFCNSLVDRIVPGKLNSNDHQKVEKAVGYTDELMIMSEVYRLWAIESDNNKVKEVLSFAQADEGVVIAPDITKYRELKLRLLNGSHSFTCALALLAGFTTVKEAMADDTFAGFIKGLMFSEIAPAITGKDLSAIEAKQFALQVLDRYSNPYLEHAWQSISMQYTSKMKMRNVPLIAEYYCRHKQAPERMAIGFAAYILLMKGSQKADGKYYGNFKGAEYLISDDAAGFYASLWNNKKTDEIVHDVLSNEELWEIDLTHFEGFEDAIKYYLKALQQDEALTIIKNTRSVKMTL
ncbi:MAG: tagaturonate reductase [Chitinophagaceae bacterium]|nr:tagaturonate reductase [Chitinophagaceae bacterium]